MTTTLQEEIVAGPLQHWRHGRILSVNPTREGNRPGRFPSQAFVVTTAARRMIELSKAGEKVDAIAVLGEGQDPALNPDFREISENLRELTNKWFGRAQLVVEVESLNLRTLEKRHALSVYDRALVRFAFGTQKTFATATGGKPQDLKQVVDDLARIETDQWILDACFTRGDADNSSDGELRALLGHLVRLRPSSIEVWTPPKATTQDGRKITPVTKTRLKAIAEKIVEKTGLHVQLRAD